MTWNVVSVGSVKSVIAVPDAPVAETSTEPDIIETVESVDVLGGESSINDWVDDEAQADDSGLDDTGEDVI